MSGQNIRGRRLPHRRPQAAEAANVHREVNKLIIHTRTKNATANKSIRKINIIYWPSDCRTTLTAPISEALEPSSPVTKML